MRTRACAACGEPVVLAELHLTVYRHVEQRRPDGLDVLDAETIATLHLRCGWGAGEQAEAHPDPEWAPEEPIPYVLTGAALGGGS
jgi:hypothetical protein